MDWGGARRRLLPLSLMALPACGLVVGFEARDVCDDCGPSSTSTGGTTALGTNGGAGTGGAGGSGERTGTVTSGGGFGGSTGGAGGRTGTTSGSTGGSGGQETTGTAGAAGDGATGPGPCHVDRTTAIEEVGGPYPVELGFSRWGAASFWRLGWLDAGALHFQSLDLAASSTSSEYSIAASENLERSSLKVAANASQVAIALGEAQENSAQVTLHYVNALNPTVGPVVVSLPLAGGAAPELGAVVPLGNSERLVVAAVTSDATGVLALFDTNQFEAPLDLGADISSIDVAWLGQRGVAAYVADGALLLAELEIDEAGLQATAWGELSEAALASTAPEHRVRAAAVGNRIALVWVDSAGLSLSTLDPALGLESASAPVRVSSPASGFPAVAGHDDEIAVSWIDADGTLYFKRYLSQTPEPTLEVARDVRDESFGFVSDPLEPISYYGLAFNGAGLEFSRIGCDE